LEFAVDRECRRRNVVICSDWTAEAITYEEWAYLTGEIVR
jgi:hypothetical protein